MGDKYSKGQVRRFARQAITRFDAGDESEFFILLDNLTKSKSGFEVIRAFGEELGKKALKEPDSYFELFDKIMHRKKEASYDPANLSDFIRKNEKNIDALVYGGRVAIIGTAFTQMRDGHWKRILEKIEAWNIEFADWYVVDSWCHHPMAHIIAEHQEKMLAKFRKWSKSENFWFRKAVPVYLHAFFVEYSGYDISPYLKILDDLMLDQENWVAKGMGWCLREMAKNYQNELVDFLKKWARVEGVKKLIYKEAIKKLDKDVREEVIKCLEKR
ncbi:DNA alkylation repair protein [candidate division WOR-3 bacterium]|nr:DNA alkylation repair protein [candidate division WOR-3 bacterium]